MSLNHSCSCAHCHQKNKSDNVNHLYSVLFITGIILFVIAISIPYYKLQFFLISYIIIGFNVIKNAIYNIIKLNPLDENFLMFIATVGAFIIGEYPEGVAVMIFYQIGEFFNEKAIKKTRKEISSLINIKPEYAILKIGEKEQKVKPDTLKVGDIIKIRVGDKVPVDCTILKGTSEFDTKILTGEFAPMLKKEGEIILSGSINISKVVYAKVNKTYENSTVSKILEIMEKTSSKKSKTENFISTFARYYTPVVVITAFIISFIPPLFTGFNSFYSWLYKGLMFLVVSCPCALVLSIPLSYFSGIGASSSKGILIKGSTYLDILSKAKTFVFDKTGTITKGEFQISKIVSKKTSDEELLEIVAHGEYNSNHPIAKGILKAYNNSINISDISEYEEISGCGVKLLYKGKPLLVGNKNLIPESENSDLTTLNVLYDNIYLGYIELEDKIKKSAFSLIKNLKNKNIKTIILSGDKKNVVENVKDQLKTDEAYYELLPQDKVYKLEEIKEKTSGYVCYVGDGINDAPSLNISDLGISMGTIGSDIAIEASDIVLTSDNLNLILDAINISRKTRKIIIENIVVILSFKFIVLLLAILSLTNMWAAVFADVGVSVIAILNSIRILK